MAASLVKEGETVEGSCVANRQGFMKMTGQSVALVVTHDRLIVQAIGPQWEPKGEPLSIRGDQIASVKRADDWEEDTILNEASVELKIKTTDGQKLRLALFHGEGLLGDLGGGDVQHKGYKALRAWLRRWD